MDVLKDRWFGTTGALRGWALWSLVANCVIIITGAVVRLTDSGLGCSNWPNCEPGSMVPRGAMGHHGLIEFGNRMLTFVLIALALGAWYAAKRSGASAKLQRLALVVLIGIPFQGVIGGITVWSHLNPWVVALHLVLSVALIVLATWVYLLARGEHGIELPSAARGVVVALFAALMVAIWLGTVVTGAGPNAGDERAPRNGLTILDVARVHSASVWISVALTVLALVLVTRAGSKAAKKLVLAVLAAELLQGAIGYAQYFNGLPTWLVICHMVGIGVVTVAVSWLFFATWPKALSQSPAA